MRVPGIIIASHPLVRDMDDKVIEQLRNVAGLPGIVRAALAMPDAHQGYGFPIGGVAAFDPDEGGVVSAGGVGFDISCGVRTLRTSLKYQDLMPAQKELADLLFKHIPAGLGSSGALRLKDRDMEAMLRGGARWAVDQGYGETGDLERIEEGGEMDGADPDCVSPEAKRRMVDEVGTLGSGNHYMEVQRVAEVYDGTAAQTFGLAMDDVVVSIHCGSRGLGHQICTDYMKKMAIEASSHGLALPDRDLACAPIRSPLGRDYLGAMSAAINCALANRQVLAHLVRQAFAELFKEARLPLLYDVSHNTCKAEEHQVDGSRGGKTRRLYVHRKGATRAFGPGHPDLPPSLRAAGQPVLVGGSMGTSSYVLAGTADSMRLSFGSACHGAGRSMSRKQATKLFNGRAVIDELHGRSILIRAHSFRGIAEEAPGAYKDVGQVIEATHAAGLARKVVRLEPVICVKG
jgi:tRNA-splicing ligase RtcB